MPMLTTSARPSSRTRSSFRTLLAACLAVLGTIVLGGCEQSMITRTTEATSVLRDYAISDTPIPKSEFESAKAIAVLRASEGGVVVTGGGGKGVMVHRTGDSWSAPIALDLAAGSFGLQIGGKSYDVVMLFRNDDEVQKVINNGGYSVADASANAGPASGDAQDNDNPVRTYVRAAGLFAGARVGGVKFIVNEKVNHETYGVSWTVEDILNGKVKRPLGTSDFYKQLPEPK
ncbi:MAG: lipid-binding SYLF domain-containing protein [Phycisphaerae bacterium]|nr:lipid-binding SYLF domain-containing protein [Phycisphaerae bacterium]